jgi:hypothetical protein
MRIWGEDNFANEGARDYLAMLAAKLVATVSEIFIDTERLELDEDGESMFMPSVELLALLCERYDIAPPKPSSVRPWQEKYLKVYDASIAKYNPDARFRVERRKAIEKTFRWLISLSESYWDN